MSHIDPSWCARINSHKAEPAPSAAAPPPFRKREIPTEHDCECCGTRMFDHNCKIICPNCGYKRDCSDP
jgi:ribosomal protein L37E